MYKEHLTTENRCHMIIYRTQTFTNHLLRTHPIILRTNRRPDEWETGLLVKKCFEHASLMLITTHEQHVEIYLLYFQI